MTKSHSMMENSMMDTNAPRLWYDQWLPVNHSSSKAWQHTPMKHFNWQHTHTHTLCCLQDTLVCIPLIPYLYTSPVQRGLPPSTAADGFRATTSCGPNLCAGKVVAGVVPKPLLGTRVSKERPSRPPSASDTLRFSKVRPRACSAHSQLMDAFEQAACPYAHAFV